MYIVGNGIFFFGSSKSHNITLIHYTIPAHTVQVKKSSFDKIKPVEALRDFIEVRLSNSRAKLLQKN